jgi:hypothetical protein
MKNKINRLLLCLLFIGTSMINVNAQTVFDPTKCYRIVNKATGKVLEVNRFADSEGAQILQATAGLRQYQQWQLIKTVDGKYNIISRYSLRLMDVVDNTPNGKCIDGTIIQQFAADGTNSQKWRLELQPDGSFKIFNETCNKALRVESGSTAEWAIVGIKNDFGAEYFKWLIQETPCFINSNSYIMYNKGTNKVLEVNRNEPSEGAQIYQWTMDYARPQQTWSIRQVNGQYNIYSYFSGKSMDASDCTEGGTIRQFLRDGTNSQNWTLELLPNGYYKIANASCNKYVRVESSSTADGANVGVKTDFGADSFLWHFGEAINYNRFTGELKRELFTFEAHAFENRAQLQWITHKNYQFDYFKVERLNEKGTFETLDTQNAFEGLQSYSFTDNTPLEGDNFYRISTVSNTEPPQYSEVKKVSFSKNTDIGIFPNPAEDYIDIDLRKYEGKTVNIYLYNTVGTVLKKLTVEKTSTAPQRLNLQALTTGAYLIRIQAEGKRDVLKQVTKVE